MNLFCKRLDWLIYLSAYQCNWYKQTKTWGTSDSYFSNNIDSCLKLTHYINIEEAYINLFSWKTKQYKWNDFLSRWFLIIKIYVPNLYIFKFLNRKNLLLICFRIKFIFQDRNNFFLYTVKVMIFLGVAISNLYPFIVLVLNPFIVDFQHNTLNVNV